MSLEEAAFIKSCKLDKNAFASKNLKKLREMEEVMKNQEKMNQLHNVFKQQLGDIAKLPRIQKYK